MTTANRKPLTAEEIAGLREAALEDQAPYETSGANRIGELTMRLLDEVERSRALLKRIEWGRLDTDQRGHCPACGAWSQSGTHQPGCELAALIGAASGVRLG